MPTPDRPRVLAVPAELPFLPWLAGFLLAGAAGDPVAMARTTVLLPGRRAVQGLREALVERADPALLLPRMVALGDVGDIDPPGDGTDQPVMARGAGRLRLAAALRQGNATVRAALAEAEAMLGALGELAAWDRTPADLTALDIEADLAGHWSRTMRRFDAVAAAWPALLAERGLGDPTRAGIDAIRALARRLRAAPPVCDRWVAAGFAAATPALGELLGVVARLPAGCVLCPGLDLLMPEEEWRDLAAHGQHPQAPLRQMLELMGVARAEVECVAAPVGPPALRQVAARALCGRVSPVGEGFACVEAATAEEEAAVIALTLRGFLERGSGTAALVTPDRKLARRVRARLARWGLRVDDSAGEPLGQTPAGTLARLALNAAAQGLGPLPVVALLEHPLVKAGEGRQAWLDRLRALELRARRHPQPVTMPQLDALADTMAPEVRSWWCNVRAWLAPLADARAETAAARMAALAEVLAALAGDALWAEPDGQALAALVDLVAEHGDPLGPMDWATVRDLLDQLASEVSVRPPPGLGHPRLAIRGLIEARLSSADLLVLGGLNDGVWPPPAAPDPCLPPLARARLGLPDARRALAVATHDAGLLLASAGDVLLTRALRDGQGPSVPSAFWVRLDASGLLRSDPDRLAWARALDHDGAPPRPMARPRPNPPLWQRPRRISAARADTMRSDPFAMFASDVLGLRRLPALGEPAGPRERGTAIHAALEAWFTAGEPPGTLADHFKAHAARWIADPVVRALWGPRLSQIAAWVEAEIRERRALGWRLMGVEIEHGMPLMGDIELRGRADWIEQRGAGERAIIDFKTGAPPSPAALRAGFGVQLGLLGALLLDRAGDARIEVGELCYWQLRGGRAQPGQIRNVLGTWVEGSRNQPAWPSAQAFIDFCLEQVRVTARRYLVDCEPLLARARPEFTRDGDDFDQLARTDEWLSELYGER